jgi:diguanylate cyclase (GGDEF)-like protein
VFRKRSQPQPSHRYFGLKLGLAVTLLTVGLTTASVYHFYEQARTLVRRQVTGRLRDIGHTSTFMLSNADRDAIARLSAAMARDAQVTPGQLAQIAPGGVLPSLTLAQSQTYQASPEIQQLTQWLRKIKWASLDQIRPLQDHYPQQFSALPNGVLPYLLVEIPQSPNRKILRFLASSDPDPEPPRWPGNPVGQLYVPIVPIFGDAFQGEFQVAQDYYTDYFYTSLTAVVPIKDRNGKVVAVLGLDYIAGSDQDYLQKLQPICLSIIGGSMVLSVILSSLLTRYFAGLRSENQELKDYSQVLERMVAERTSSLQMANSHLRELASLDSLTQVSNRRYFDHFLAAEWQKAANGALNLALLLCDVDHFKAYNDTYGHVSGDLCLQKVAQALESCVHRHGDLVARYGGEEFAIILTNIDAEGARQVAERVRMAVKALMLEHPASSNGVVTISVGVAYGSSIAEMTIVQLIENADRGLYQAKRAGRNQMGVYTPSVAQKKEEPQSTAHPS